jgi:hypothetical protein
VCLRPAASFAVTHVSRAADRPRSRRLIQRVNNESGPTMYGPRPRPVAGTSDAAKPPAHCGRDLAVRDAPRGSEPGVTPRAARRGPSRTSPPPRRRLDRTDRWAPYQFDAQTTIRPDGVAVSDCAAMLATADI